jgi:hypothetical protein
MSQTTADFLLFASKIVEHSRNLPAGAEISRPCCREFTTIKRRERLLEGFLK